MNTHARFVYRIGIVSMSITGLLALAIVGLEIYVRWFVNQNFTFLGGSALEALVMAFALQLIALVWATK